MKRYSDKQRLDFLERCKRESAPHEWVAVFDDGTLILDEPDEINGKYDVLTKPRPNIRQAIDAAMKSVQKPRRSVL